MPGDTDPRWAEARRRLVVELERAELTVGMLAAVRPASLRLALDRADQFDGLVAALRAARQFIRNGCEFGYIRMPERPDSALDTLPLIEAALADAKETCQ